MRDILEIADVTLSLESVGSICQMLTAVIVAAVGVITYRHTRRQGALTLINHNNALANLMNSTIIASADARAALGRLHDPIVGCPDDAVLFIYLNYVHNTYRMHCMGAVSAQVWRDTLASCVATTRRLRPDQLQRLLSRGYELKFRSALLTEHARAHANRSRPGQLHLVGSGDLDLAA
jgi:hypothetical protein